MFFKCFLQTENQYSQRSASSTQHQYSQRQQYDEQRQYRQEQQYSQQQHYSQTQEYSQQQTNHQSYNQHYEYQNQYSHQYSWQRNWQTSNGIPNVSTDKVFDVLKAVIENDSNNPQKTLSSVCPCLNQHINPSTVAAAGTTTVSPQMKSKKETDLKNESPQIQLGPLPADNNNWIRREWLPHEPTKTSVVNNNVNVPNLSNNNGRDTIEVIYIYPNRDKTRYLPPTSSERPIIRNIPIEIQTEKNVRPIAVATPISTGFRPVILKPVAASAPVPMSPPKTFDPVTTTIKTFSTTPAETTMVPVTDIIDGNEENSTSKNQLEFI